MKRIIVALIIAAGPAWPAAGIDPDWPCIQRKQPHLSLGQVWTGPLPDAAVRLFPRSGAAALGCSPANAAPTVKALIDGIARYGRSQVDMARRIEERRAAMAELESATDPDFDAIDAAEEALDWDQRIFTERQQSLTYVCETPVILEQRAFALGRAIASHLGD